MILNWRKCQRSVLTGWHFWVSLILGMPKFPSGRDINLNVVWLFFMFWYCSNTVQAPLELWRSEQYKSLLGFYLGGSFSSSCKCKRKKKSNQMKALLFRHQHLLKLYSWRVIVSAELHSKSLPHRFPGKVCSGSFYLLTQILQEKSFLSNKPLHRWSYSPHYLCICSQMWFMR